MKNRRQFVRPIAAMVLLSPLFGCAAGGSKEKRMVELTFGVINYTNRMIFDVALNGHGWGGAAPYNGGVGAMLFTPLELGGPQTLTWRLDGPRGMPGNGDTVTAKNQLYIREEDIPRAAKSAPHICIHIYPDQTAEITYTSGATPQPTERGLAILKEQGK